MQDKVIDAHQHYWDVGKFDYGWSRAGLDQLNRDFLPGDLEPHLRKTGVTRTVMVQVLHASAETKWMLDLAAQTSRVAGVVGWVDLTASPDHVIKELDRFKYSKKLCGVRHLAHNEPDDEWLVRPRVIEGLTVLSEERVAFDLVLRPQHLKHVPTLSERCPELVMVIDHLAKPAIRDGIIEPWKTDLQRAARNPKVACKLSGMVTEADLGSWRAEEFAPYVEAAMEAFGPDRLMFGSDWPVCTLAGSYERVYEALRKVLGNIDPSSEAAIFRNTAERFYSLAPI